MTTIIRTVILANSIKHAPGRCIAGRQLLTQDGFALGPWVRPISTIGEGQLYAHQYQIEGGGTANLFDIFDLPLKMHCADAAQPENWLIDEATPWRRIGVWPTAQLTQCYDTPQNLWIEPGSKTDRVSELFLANHPVSASLYMIPLLNPQISPDYWKPKRDRLSFEYGGHQYDLGITDPLYSRQLNQAPPRAACISLTPAFKGHHYKVAANLIW